MVVTIVMMQGADYMHAVGDQHARLAAYHRLAQRGGRHSGRLFSSTPWLQLQL